MPSSRGLSRLGIEPMSLTSPAWAGGFFTAMATWEAQSFLNQPSLCISRARSCLDATPVLVMSSFSGLQECPRKMRKVISLTLEGVSLTDSWETTIKERQ